MPKSKKVFLLTCDSKNPHVLPWVKTFNTLTEAKNYTQVHHSRMVSMDKPQWQKFSVGKDIFWDSGQFVYTISKELIHET